MFIRLFMLLVMLWMGCEASPPVKDVRPALFPDNTNLFRGVNLGDSLAVIKEKEGNNPLYEDALGLAYQLALPSLDTLKVEYFTDNVTTSEGGNQLIAIAAEIHPQNISDALKYTSAIEKYLSSRFGKPEGSYGHYLWISALYHCEISLELSEKQAVIRLAFVSI